MRLSGKSPVRAAYYSTGREPCVSGGTLLSSFSLPFAVGEWERKGEGDGSPKIGLKPYPVLCRPFRAGWDKQRLSLDIHQKHIDCIVKA